MQQAFLFSGVSQLNGCVLKALERILYRRWLFFFKQLIDLVKHPGVVHDLTHLNSCGWVFVKHLLDEVKAIGTKLNSVEGRFVF